MKARHFSPLRIAATALFVAGLGVFASAGNARADTLIASGPADYMVIRVTPSEVIAHVGPGLGSAKTPTAGAASASNRVWTRGARFYHTIGQASVAKALNYHMGPGLGCVKSPPFNNPY